VTSSERFSCSIQRDDDGRILTLEVAAVDLEDGKRIVKVEGVRAAHAAASVQDIMRSANLRGRQWTSRSPIELEPALGAHVELLLRAVKPLRRLDRIDAVAEGIAGMSREESSYWHAQTARRHGLRALRILLDGGVKR
jgi:hypothetical protein